MMIFRLLNNCVNDKNFNVDKNCLAKLCIKLKIIRLALPHLGCGLGH